MFSFITDLLIFLFKKFIYLFKKITVRIIPYKMYMTTTLRKINSLYNYKFLVNLNLKIHKNETVLYYRPCNTISLLRRKLSNSAKSIFYISGFSEGVFENHMRILRRFYRNRGIKVKPLIKEMNFLFRSRSYLSWQAIPSDFNNAALIFFIFRT